ncbi:TrmB family transcriptional regulator [Halosimplex litoreum]|uniref:TrmB family transcriptional regulator n=1 Tax=Halosimplex litoreum TaxID=1198301 RepID=A0A7T3FZ24_9EURY|nr:TrmB family transcriptional regulator [Halosimplex litoreum]QPV63365.1 TrmB family transcriptional regulator [Halosimplex litoreum]
MTDEQIDDGTLRDELNVFGFSDTEIDTYLAILEQGETTVRTVAEAADVTQRAVYNIAERLQDRGLVRVNDHASPTTIRALPPEEAIDALSNRLESITPTLENRFNETEPKTPEIQIIKARETAVKRLRRGISEADHEVLVAVPGHSYEDIEPELRDAVDRGVLVFLLVGGMADIDADELGLDETAAVVRSWSESLPFMYAADDEAAMIGHSGILSGTHVDKEAVTVTQDNLAGAIVGLYFGAYWPAATEVHVREPGDLPRTFDWFRHSVLEAVLHRREGAELEAVVRTDEGPEVAGRVSQVRQAFVEPATNDYTLETSLYVETDAGEVSIGGPGSFIEEYEGQTVTLQPVEE